MSELNMKGKRKDNGISEILGTVLLLAISVALFSVLYLMLQNVLVAEHAPVADFIGYIDEDTVYIEHHGGNSLPNSIAITVTVGSTRHIIDFDNNFDENNNGFWDIGERVYFTSSQIDDSFGVSVSVVDVTSNTLLYGGTLKEGIIDNQDEDPVPPDQNTLAVSHWRFDDNNGCIALDSYDDNHGLLRPDCANSAPTWVEGKINSALFFDGIDDYVQVDDASNLNPRSAITISAWIKWAIDPTTGGSWTSIVSKDGDRQYRLQHNQDNSRFEFAVRTSSGGRWLTSATTPIENVWYYVVGTYDGESLKIYVNGSLENSISYSGDILQSSSPLLIGRHSNTGRNFNGIIDEVALYNRTLSANEIMDQYLQTISQESQNDTLIAHWKFNEAKGSIANDSSENGNHGTINTALWKMGVNGTALYFNGVDSNVHVYREDHPELDPVENITVMAWVKNTDLNNNYMNNILGRSGGSDGYSYRLYLNDGSSHDNIGVSIRTQTGGIQSREWTWTEMNESWFHLAMTFSNENGGTLRLYHNSAEVGNWDNIGQNLRYRTTFAGDDLYIGSGYQFTSNYFNGLIDDVRIYNYALSNQEIVSIYDSTKPSEENLLSIWSFNENTGTIAYDSAGDNHGIINGATWTKGINGSALSFDGDRDYVSIDDDNSLDLSDEGTIEAWVYITNYQPYAGIVHKGNRKDFSDEAYSLQFWENSGTIRFALFNDNGDYDHIDSTVELEVNRWYHLASTWNESILALYIDGSIDNSKENVIGSVRNTNGSLQIGSQLTEKYNNNFGYIEFEGAIDEVKIYHTALTPGEIYQSFLSNNQAESGQGGRIARWGFNEQTGTTAADSIGSNDGAISGADWISGKQGNALDFDGSNNDLVTIPYDSSLALDHNFSVSFWIYPTSNTVFWRTILARSSQFTCSFIGGNKIRVHINGYANIDSQSTAPRNSWTHVVFTFQDSDGGSDIIHLYINGEEDGQVGPTWGTPNTPSNPLYFGGDAGSSFFTGRLDDMIIYDNALSAAEVSTLFNQYE